MNITPAKIISSIALAASISLTACAPQPSQDQLKPRTEPCREVVLTSAQAANMDFNGEGSEWIEENGDGAIAGYSHEEDSIIWNTRACMEANPAYAN